MFSGIVQYSGKLKKIYQKSNEYIINVDSKLKLSKNEIGSSICCSGVCLTLTKFKRNTLTFYISNETLKKSNFKHLKIGSIINMEKSLKLGDHISGHFVQGHVDTTGIIKKIKFIGKSYFIDIQILNKFKKYLIYKGSIAINGVSLTISKTFKNGFQIVIIPHTLKLTNLKKLKVKDIVNVEFDIVGKYINNLKNV